MVQNQRLFQSTMNHVYSGLYLPKAQTKSPSLLIITLQLDNDIWNTLYWCVMVHPNMSLLYFTFRLLGSKKGKIVLMLM